MGVKKGGSMKKLILTMLTVMLTVGLAFASPVNTTIISTTQLDNDPTSVVSSVYNIQDYKKVGFWVSYDETQVGNSISLAVTLSVSYDGTNFVSGSFMDVAGGTTPQTSETISDDGWYFFWLEDGWPFKYVRVTLTATNTDADDIASVAAYMAGVK